jgi:hypothetical protein
MSKGKGKSKSSKSGPRQVQRISILVLDTKCQRSSIIIVQYESGLGTRKGPLPADAKHKWGLARARMHSHTQLPRQGCGSSSHRVASTRELLTALEQFGRDFPSSSRTSTSSTDTEAPVISNLLSLPLTRRRRNKISLCFFISL